jgi:hypothetical protein
VWIEDEEAIATVDLANAAYGLMLRMLAGAYALKSPSPEKAFLVEAGIDLMKIMALLGERAARLPAGPSHPDCHAGVSFTALRDAAALPPGEGARRFVIERLDELGAAAQALAGGGDERAARAAVLLSDLGAGAKRRLAEAALPPPAREPIAAPAAPPLSVAGPEIAQVDGVEVVEGGARRTPGHRPRPRRSPDGARQPGDHQRHGPGGRPGAERTPVPLRGKREQAVLRRQPRACRVPVVGAPLAGRRGVGLSIMAEGQFH